MAYEPQEWVNEPSTATPISADRLNYMEAGIAAASTNTLLITEAYTASPGDVILCGLGGYQVTIPDGDVNGQTITLNSHENMTNQPVDVEYFGLYEQITYVSTLPAFGGQMILRYLKDVEVEGLTTEPISGWYQLTFTP